MQTQELFFQNGSVWAISTSSWTGSDRLEASDLGKTEEEIPDIFRLGRKYLLPDEWRIKLNRPRTQMKAFMDRVGRPFFLRGAWFVPDSKLLLAKEGLDKVQETQRAIVEDLVRELPTIKEERIAAYPVLADAVWPTPDQVRQSFKIRTFVFEITETSARPTDSDLLIEAREEFRSDLRRGYDELKAEILRQAHEEIVTVCEDIANKILVTGDKITKTTLKQPMKIVDQYMNIASIFDADEIKEEVSKLKEVVEGAEAKEIRETWEVARQFADAMSKIGKNVGDLSGYNKEGRVKRKVKIDPDETADEAEAASDI